MKNEKILKIIREELDLFKVLDFYNIEYNPSKTKQMIICPFHSEIKPSLSISEDGKLWHCFGCNAGGDVIKFIEEIAKCDFKEAIEIAKEILGIKKGKIKIKKVVKTKVKEKILFEDVQEDLKNKLLEELKLMYKTYRIVCDFPLYLDKIYDYVLSVVFEKERWSVSSVRTFLSQSESLFRLSFENPPKISRWYPEKV